MLSMQVRCLHTASYLKQVLCAFYLLFNFTCMEGALKIIEISTKKEKVTNIRKNICL